VDAEQLAIQQLLAQNPLFAGATAAEIAFLLAVGRRRGLRPQEQLFAVGSPGHELFLVLAGSIHILMPSQDGDVLVERFARGELLGEVAVLDDQPRTATGVAAEPSEVLAIGRGDFHAFLDAFPRYRERLIAILVQRLRRTSSLVSEMLTVDSGVTLPPEPYLGPPFETTIVGYGRYGNNYIGPKYAKTGYPWDVAAIVDPTLTPQRFAVSVLGRGKPDTRLFRTFDEWHAGYFTRLGPEQQKRHVVEIPLKPELLFDQALRYMDAEVRQFILPKPVVMNGAQLRGLIDRVERDRIKAAVASQWYYSDFPRVIRRELRLLSAERGDAPIHKVESEFSKEHGLAYATPPPLLELPHVLQLLCSTGLIDIPRDTPDVRGTPTLVELAYHPQEIVDGVYVRAGTDYRPSPGEKRNYPNWDYQLRVLKVFFDANAAEPELAIDFWIKFIRSGDIAIRPGQIRIRDAGDAAPRFLELNFVDDQLLRMNRAIFAAFAQPYERFQHDPRVLSLERYRAIGEQLMAIQAAWERAATDQTPPWSNRPASA
jgi:CRP-like cAMP-binding protein